MATPMMRQYKRIKGQYRDYIVFFRLGDFYEMFYEDALLCSRVLEITLTSRDAANKVPMAGVPYHAADQYIAKLVKKGYKVVICEQVEDPKTSKGLVKREVVKIITPGTITDLKTLEDEKNNYLGCIIRKNDIFGLSFVDLTTGDFFCTELKSDYPFSEFLGELAKYNVSEYLITPQISEDKLLIKKIKEITNAMLTLGDEEDYHEKPARDMLTSNIKEGEMGELLKHKLAMRAAGSCLRYLEKNHNNIFHINSVNHYRIQNYMGLDFSCKTNLELTRNLKDGKKEGSLLGVLDNTYTSMGARLLLRWVERPLIDISKIAQRHDAVEELNESFFSREELAESLKDVYDLERLSGKLACGGINARDLLAIKRTVAVLPKVKQSLKSCKAELLKSLEKQMDPLEDVFALIDDAIADDPPVSIKESGIIKDGFNVEIDRLRRASREGKIWLTDLERRERDRTGIKSLKVGFNRVFGYYIEVTKANLSSVPEDYTRRQTLANSERYITEELKEYEALILNAQDKLIDLEYDEFSRIRELLIQQMPRLKMSSYAISVVDVILSLSLAANKSDYIKPKMVSGNTITIHEGRHPVVEYYQQDTAFIPNDTHIGDESNMISIITGPNMAGKSTYMRQVALIVLMAQIGSFVPAKSACIGVVDKIFTRIGASDNLASGQSTFMVEMMEVSEILKNSTEKSLLILDEVGRGTSTYDGLSIAWAVLEYIHEQIRAKTLFATHYYELTALKDLSKVRNFRVTVKEEGDDVIFLRKIVVGRADKSYGVQVARLAGLPQPVINRARELLRYHETRDQTSVKFVCASDDVPQICGETGHDIEEGKDIIQAIKDVDINSITPLDALSLLHSFKSKLE